MRLFSSTKPKGSAELLMVLPLFLVLAWSSFWIFDFLDQKIRHEHAAWTAWALESFGYPEDERKRVIENNLNAKGRLPKMNFHTPSRDFLDYAMLGVPAYYWRGWHREIELPDMMALWMLLYAHRSRELHISEKNPLNLRGFQTDSSDVEMAGVFTSRSRSELKFRVAGDSFASSGGLKHLLWLEMTRDTDYPCLHPYGWGVIDILEIAGKSLGVPLGPMRKFADRTLEAICPF